MKLFLVAITVIGAIHHGHGTHITLDRDTSADIILKPDTPACDLSTVLEKALAEAGTMGCTTDVDDEDSRVCHRAAFAVSRGVPEMWEQYKSAHSAVKPAYAAQINKYWREQYYEKLYTNEHLVACDDRKQRPKKWQPTPKDALGLALVDLKAIGECFMCRCEGNANAKRESGERCDHRCGARYPYSEADGGGASGCSEGRTCSRWGWCQG